MTQQLRESFPDDSTSRYLIYDNDSIFSDEVKDAIESFGIQSKRTAYRSPWQNGTAERWVGSYRRELLDHVIVFNEKHLRRLLREYVSYYNAKHARFGCDTRRRVGLWKLDPVRMRRLWACRALVVSIIATSGGRPRSDLCLWPKRTN